jgi:hypothetical protein
MAVHEVDLTVVREALAFARVHEALPLAGAGQPDRRDVVAVALAVVVVALAVVVVALAHKRNTEQKPPSRRRIYNVGLSSHTLFSSQAINASRSATTS